MMAWLTRLVTRYRASESEVWLERAWRRVCALEAECDSLRIELRAERQRSAAADRRIGELLRLLADRRTT